MFIISSVDTFDHPFPVIYDRITKVMSITVNHKFTFISILVPLAALAVFLGKCL